MKKLLWTILIFKLSLGAGQDPQFSQYYSAPLLLNPALAGATECERFGMNARSQWVGLNRSFKTVSAYMDMNLAHLRSGVGIMALHDNIGQANLSTNEVNLYYSFRASLSDNFHLRLGAQAGWVRRSIDYGQLIFEDQFSGTVVTNDFTIDPVKDYGNVGYMDFSGGMMAYNENFWLGLSAHHLNRPDQSFYLEPSPQPIKFSIHGGYNFDFTHHRGLHGVEDKEFRITPTFVYKGEQRFDQIDLGVYVLKSHLLYGVWYRGIVFKEDEGIRNNDAVIMQIGFHPRDLSIIYSYDITTSKLRMANTLGSHEISLIYEFCLKLPHRKRHVYKRLPCPDFFKSQQHKQQGNGF